MKYLFILFAVFISINFSQGLSMGVVPEQINFSSLVGIESCGNFSIISKGFFYVSDSWAKEGHLGRDLIGHGLNASSLGLSVRYPHIIFGNSTNEVCIVSKNAGRYHGVLLFRQENSNVGMGIWIYTESMGENDFIALGNVIGSSGSENLVSLVLVLIFIALVLVLVFLIRRGTNNNIN